MAHGRDGNIELIRRLAKTAIPDDQQENRQIGKLGALRFYAKWHMVCSASKFIRERALLRKTTMTFRKVVSVPDLIKCGA
jgi:hypothetical protein